MVNYFVIEVRPLILCNVTVHFKLWSFVTVTNAVLPCRLEQAKKFSRTVNACSVHVQTI